MEKNENAVNHPSHYTRGGIEVIDFIEAYRLGFNDGNAVKYISRAGYKDPTKTIEDLKKALWYIKRQKNYVAKLSNFEWYAEFHAKHEVKKSITFTVVEYAKSLELPGVLVDVLSLISRAFIDNDNGPDVMSDYRIAYHTLEHYILELEQKNGKKTDW